MFQAPPDMVVVIRDSVRFHFSRRQSRSCVHCPGARQKTPSVRWRSLLKSKKNKTICLMWTCKNADTSAISNTIGMIHRSSVSPSAASFLLCFIFISYLFFFFWYASQKTLGLCHTLRLTIPHYRPGGMRVTWCSWWGVPGQADSAWKPWVKTVISETLTIFIKAKNSLSLSAAEPHEYIFTQCG